MSRCFQEWLYHFAFQECIKVPVSLHPHQHLKLSFFKKVFVIAVKEYLIVALIIMLSIFSHAYLKNMYFIWCSVCTNICPFWLMFLLVNCWEVLWIFFCAYWLQIYVHSHTWLANISSVTVTDILILLTIF